MLTFIMLSMVILAFGLTQALLCDIWLVLWIFGEATKVIPHRQNNTSWPKQYLLTLANVRVRTWKQWVTVSEQRTSKSKHLDHHQVLTFREKTSLQRLHNNHCGTFPHLVEREVLVGWFAHLCGLSLLKFVQFLFDLLYSFFEAFMNWLGCALRCQNNDQTWLKKQHYGQAVPEECALENFSRWSR